MPDEERDYFLLTGSTEDGPFSVAELQAMVAAGEVERETLYARPGMTDWKPLSAMLPPENQEPPLRDLNEIATALAALSTYSALEAWKQQAKKEKDQLDQAADSINHNLQFPSQETIDLSEELDRAKLEFKHQPLLKRILGSNDAEKAITAQIAAIEQASANLRAKMTEFQETAANLQKLIGFAAQFGPTTAAEKDLLVKNLTLQKKELQVKKREASTAAAAIRREAQTQSAHAGKRGLFGVTGSFGDGSFSDKLAWYDPSLAADQRRAIRGAKENALRPYESAKAEIDQQLINLEKHLLWIKQFHGP